MNIKEILGAAGISSVLPVCTVALSHLYHGVQYRFL